MLDNVCINVPKQAQVIHSNDNTSVKHERDGEKQLQIKNKGNCRKYVDTDDNCEVIKHLVIKNSDKNLETKQITKNSIFRFTIGRQVEYQLFK